MQAQTHVRRQFFIGCGLAKKEAEVYDLLLTNGEMSAARIEKESGHGKNVYNLLKTLERKGLVLKFQKERKSWYQPGDPQNLHKLVEEQVKSAQQLNETFEQLLPKIRQDYLDRVNRPVVEYFVGEAGLKLILEDIYAPKDDVVYGAVEPDRLEKLREGITKSDLVPRRQASGLKVRAVFPNTKLAKWLHERDGEHFRKSILIDKDKYPMPGQIEVYGDKIALLSFRQGQFVGMLIEHDELATTLKSLFTLVFDKTAHVGE